MKSTVPTKTVSENKEPLPPPVASPEYTNGNHLPSDNSTTEPQTTVVQNGLSDHHLEEEIDNDDGQWSDWEHDPDLPEASIDLLPTLPSFPPPTVEEPVISKSVSSPIKSLKLNNIPSSRWNPNAPLGSEYEIPPVVLKKQNSRTAGTLANQDGEDFFKDMTPKVETVELMRQLETMFSVNAEEPNEQIKSTTTRTTKAAASSATFSNKFGISSQGYDDNQEIDTENNNWDE